VAYKEPDMTKHVLVRYKIALGGGGEAERTYKALAETDEAAIEAATQGWQDEVNAKVIDGAFIIRATVVDAPNP
jgi:hypothetical protein